MITNEQAPNEQLIKETKESLILIGIANSILKMRFPKMNNLKEMLSFFDYEVNISSKRFESKNSVVAFFMEHNKIKSVITSFELKLAEKNSTYNKISGVFAGILKKIALCENIMNVYMGDDELKSSKGVQLVNFDKHHDRYYRIIEFLSERGNILTPNLPIFQYDNKTYSVGEQTFKDENELIDFLYNKTDIMFIYQFKIYNNNSIILKYCIEKK
jgi:hypothetical protein